MTFTKAHAHSDETSREYFHHSSAPRVNTDVVLIEALRSQYPDLELIVVPAGPLNLLAYASAGYAIASPLEDPVNDPVYSRAVKWRSYIPPTRRLDGGSGEMLERVIFGKYEYKFQGAEILLYLANGRDGGTAYPAQTNHYILTSSPHKVDDLIKEAMLWGTSLHDEVWVFDGGAWQKSRELWGSVQKSHWEDVILDQAMKTQLQTDVANFFDGQATYADLKVPWKRGCIMYGPPGNGKTISIKAIMHSLYDRGTGDDSRLPVPTLYVRTLASFAGPEFSLRQIFSKAREAAPCYLVFEDLDSLVTDHVRSYFLNEIDGLESNDGIFMVGSTNHLERLDPGIAKRPSRFDRKYFFGDPNFEQRVQYAKFWQHKLKDNKQVVFPDALCPAVAKITDKFSFAYMQEGFVASLLAIAARHPDAAGVAAESRLATFDSETSRTAQIRAIESKRSDAWRACGTDAAVWELLKDHLDMTREDWDSGYPVVLRGGRSDPDLSDLVLWKELKKQIAILREEMEQKAKVSEGSGKDASKESQSSKELDLMVSDQPR